MREPAGREGGERGWDKVRRVVWGMVEERREQRKALGLLGVQLGARLPPPASSSRGMLVLPPPAPAPWALGGGTPPLGQQWTGRWPRTKGPPPVHLGRRPLHSPPEVPGRPQGPPDTLRARPAARPRRAPAAAAAAECRTGGPAAEGPRS